MLEKKTKFQFLWTNTKNNKSKGKDKTNSTQQFIKGRVKIQKIALYQIKKTFRLAKYKE